MTEGFAGALHYRGSDDYERIRTTMWNKRTPRRFPEAILCAASDRDVANGVRWAKDRGLRVAVRSGGHSWVGSGIRNGSLLIDLAGLDSIEVDPAARVAAVGPGTRGNDLNARLADQKLVFPTGHCPTVGLGGFLLGGGYGWNSRALGPACFSVRAVDVVLPDGSLVHADDETAPDIIWAARGSGAGFFGVVTRFYLDVAPAYQQIVRSSYLFPGELRDEVLAWTYETVDTISPWLEMSARVCFEPGYDKPMTMVTAAAFCRQSGDEAMLAAVEAAPFISSSVRTVHRRVATIADMYDVADRLLPEGSRYAVDGVWTSAPATDILRLGGDILAQPPTRASFMLWMLWGHVDERPDACWSTQGRLYFSPNAVWDDPADDLRNEVWAHAALDALSEIDLGTQFSDQNPADRPSHGLEAGQRQRLAELRATYDPSGLLCGYLRPEESTTRLGVMQGAASPDVTPAYEKLP